MVWVLEQVWGRFGLDTRTGLGQSWSGAELVWVLAEVWGRFGLGTRTGLGQSWSGVIEQVWGRVGLGQSWPGVLEQVWDKVNSGESDLANLCVSSLWQPSCISSPMICQQGWGRGRRSSHSVACYGSGFSHTLVRALERCQIFSLRL